MDYEEYGYRMSEVNQRVRNGLRISTVSSKKARRRLIGAWVGIGAFIAAMLAVYVYSLT